MNTKLNATQIARELRKKMTRSEKILWQELRNHKIGVRVRRQVPLVLGDKFFVVDFYVASCKLIIEIDGEIHNDYEIALHDDGREEILKEYGYSVIRFTNEMVLSNLNKVVSDIESNIS